MSLGISSSPLFSTYVSDHPLATAYSLTLFHILNSNSPSTLNQLRCLWVPRTASTHNSSPNGLCGQPTGGGKASAGQVSGLSDTRYDPLPPSTQVQFRFRRLLKIGSLCFFLTIGRSWCDCCSSMDQYRRRLHAAHFPPRPVLCLAPLPSSPPQVNWLH